jgi:hypothetical protein
MPPLAICVTKDPGLKRTLRRTLQAAGSDVRFLESVDAVEAGSVPIDMIVLDHQARVDSDLSKLKATLGDQARIIILGESLQEDEVLTLLHENSLNHVITDGKDPDEDELVVTSVKLFKGDLFGLEKYLAWGVTVHELEIADYDEKRQAIQRATDFARDAGGRRQVVARIETVADELLMNALYDAPAVRYGVRPRIGTKARGSVGPLGGERAKLRYACDGRHFALSVQDNYGELKKNVLLDHVARARAERGNPKVATEAGGGAGLGLYFVLASVTRFIANIEPGVRTEVICMFDMKATGREQEGYARSLHIFSTATS